MLVIGMTGRSGSGKSTVCALFGEKGIPSLDTDLVSRLVYEPGQACYRELVGRFGEEILNEEKKIDRKKLFVRAFASEEDYASLNEIAHRHILDYARKWLAFQKEQGKAAAIIDAPLLFESGFDAECDLTIGVIAEDALRTKRLLSRDFISEEAIRTRLSKQKDDEFYLANCSVMVYNTVEKQNSLREQVEDLIRDYITKENENGNRS